MVDELQAHATSTSTAASPAYREVTFAAVLLGILQGVLMTAAFVYIGLKLGFGLPGSSVAAIMGFALLRGLGRGVLGVSGAGSIAENNINQTVASGINTASSGVVFTLPALLLMGVEFELWSVLLAAIAGSFMGIVVIVPLRKQMIEIERLRFPSGVAVATILRSPGAGMGRAVLLAIGALFAAAITLLAHHRFELIPESLALGPAIAELLDLGSGSAAGLALGATTLSLSMASFGAGMLSGKGGLPFVIGGCVAWWVIAPGAVSAGWTPPVQGQELWGVVYGTMLRPVGIGVLIGGALGSVIAAYPAIRGALRALGSASAAARATRGAATPDELPPSILKVGLSLSFVALLVVCLTAGGDAAPSLLNAVVVAAAGTLWLGLAGLIVAQATGATDISPLSGLALIAVTLMLALSGGNVVLAVTIGVAVCIATSQCADMMTDLKTGHLIGAIPRKQQLVQICVAWIGPLVAVGTTLLLWNASGAGNAGFGPGSEACASGASSCLPAPQASVLQGMVEGVLGGNAPVDKYLAGGALGAALTVLPIGGVGVLVGLAMYLPFHITFGYGLGCMVHLAVARLRGAGTVGDLLVPLAAGLIVGEALTSLVMTMLELR